MDSTLPLESRTGETGSDDALPREIRELLQNADSDAFETALERMLRNRDQELFRTLGHLARDMHDSVRHLASEVGADSDSDSVQHMRQHLTEALDMSSQAAHRNLDMVEDLRPQAARLGASAASLNPDSDALAFRRDAMQLAAEAGGFAEACQQRFGEIVLMQSWQDLSGQRVKQVMAFIERLEGSLLELVRLTGRLAGGESRDSASMERISNQNEVDRLLAEFGF